MTAIMKNIGAFIKLLRASDNVSVTAGGAGDNVQVVGATIDRGAYGMPLSCVFGIGYKAVLAQAATISLAWAIYHSDAADMSGEIVFDSALTAVVDTGGAGGSTQSGLFEIDHALDGAKRYFRLKYTPDLSAANTDTATLNSQVALGGTQTVPI